MKQERACRRHIVLLGIGHTNAHIVRMWAMNPLPDTDLTCVSDSAVTTYSGYLPAVLAGQLPVDAMEIDLVRLCAAAGARLIIDRATGLDREQTMLLFEHRPPVHYDVLSIGIGSVPQMPDEGIDSPNLVPIKPMRTFLPRLDAAIAHCESSKPLNIVVAGGGAAGVEVTQCLAERLYDGPLTAPEGHRTFTITLVTSSSSLLSGCSSKTIARVQRMMDDRGNQTRNNTTITAVRNDHVIVNDGDTLPADIVVWATGATAPTLLSEFHLPTDDRGFLLTHNTLQSTSGDPVFVVGDSGTIQGNHLPKAGVYAVRQGPVLWDNIQRHLNDQSLLPYQPQATFLKLLNMGDGRAVGEWRGWSFSGRWAMKLKMSIDQKFMDMYQLLPDTMPMPDDVPCRGCGCKLGADELTAALGDSSAEREDATVIVGPPASTAVDHSDSVLTTTDFFSAPFDDPWLVGRIAAIHAASDLYATGAAPFAAESIVVLPDGDAATQQRMLSDLRAGSALEFDRMGARITGGHTITGPRWEVGFTVFGRPLGKILIRKHGANPGDCLFLTKPLGSGILMAAHMRAQCRHRDYQTLLAVMLNNNHQDARIAVDCRIRAGTDITGFGLLGHLHEMLTDDISARLDFDTIPFLPGAREASTNDISSSLLPSNRSFLNGVTYGDNMPVDLLLDPQTCGGLLVAVPSESADRFVIRYTDHGDQPPVEIGTIERAEKGGPRIVIV